MRPIYKKTAVFLTLAALTAYWLNRSWTFRGAPDARWVHDPATFASLAVAAGLVDLAVLALAIGSGAPILAAKVAAVLVAAGLRWVGYRWVLFVEVRRELAERRGPTVRRGGRGNRRAARGDPPPFSS